jgi:hypothetical protein
MIQSSCKKNKEISSDENAFETSFSTVVPVQQINGATSTIPGLQGFSYFCEAKDGS